MKHTLQDFNRTDLGRALASAIRFNNHQRANAIRAEILRRVSEQGE